MRDTRVASKTAKASAEHIPRIERAYLFVKVNVENFGSIPTKYIEINDSNFNERIGHLVVVDFAIENLEKTPAIIRQVSATLRHLTALSNEPNYDTELLVPKNRFLGAGGETIPEIKVNEPIPTYEAVRQLWVGESFVWFYGRVIYDDIFGEEYEHRFIWRFSQGFFLITGRKIT